MSIHTFQAGRNLQDQLNLLNKRLRLNLGEINKTIAPYFAAVHLGRHSLEDTDIILIDPELSEISDLIQSANKLQQTHTHIYISCSQRKPILDSNIVFYAENIFNARMGYLPALIANKEQYEVLLQKPDLTPKTREAYLQALTNIEDEITFLETFTLETVIESVKKLQSDILAMQNKESHQVIRNLVEKYVFNSVAAICGGIEIQDFNALTKLIPIYEVEDPELVVGYVIIFPKHLLDGDTTLNKSTPSTLKEFDTYWKPDES